MKSATDPRHQKRIAEIQSIFAASFRNDDSYPDYLKIERYQIDEKIKECAPEWPLDKIAKIDLAILRYAIWEMTVNAKEPPKVVIDESVEIAKTFGNQNSPQFINGVLGTIYSKYVGKKEDES